MSGDHTTPAPSGGLETNSEAPDVIVTSLLEAETTERFVEILEEYGNVLEALQLLLRWMRLHDRMETASKITQEQVQGVIYEIAAHPATQWLIEQLERIR